MICFLYCSLFIMDSRYLISTSAGTIDMNILVAAIYVSGLTISCLFYIERKARHSK